MPVTVTMRVPMATPAASATATFVLAPDASTSITAARAGRITSRPPRIACDRCQRRGQRDDPQPR
jgi:hypothetical protein